MSLIFCIVVMVAEGACPEAQKQLGWLGDLWQLCDVAIGSYKGVCPSDS